MAAFKNKPSRIVTFLAALGAAFATIILSELVFDILQMTEPFRQRFKPLFIVAFVLTWFEMRGKGSIE